MAKQEDAEKARTELHGSQVEGRKIEVNCATARIHSKKAKTTPGSWLYLPFYAFLPGVLDPAALNLAALQNVALANAQRAMYIRANPLLAQSLLAGRGLIPALAQPSMSLGLGAQMAALHGQPLLVGGTAASLPQQQAALAAQLAQDPTTAALFNQQAALGKWCALLNQQAAMGKWCAFPREINDWGRVT